MDLRLFGRVLRRFKYVVSAGFVVAVLLSVLTIAKIDLSHGMPHLAARKPPVYQSSATLLLTQPGFPWGSAVQQYSTGRGGPVPVGDMGRLTALANLYVQIANSDMIKALVVRRAPYGGTISATQNYAFTPAYTSSPLPMITISGTGITRANAVATAQAGVDALNGYLSQQQSAAGISDAQRVVFQELTRPRKTRVVNPIKKTLPVVVFLTVMLAVVGLSFVLENLRPQVPQAVALRPETEPATGSARRSA